MSDTEGQDELPAFMLPWASKYADYATAAIAAHLGIGDWDVVTTASQDAQLEQNRMIAGFLAASSGAATELDYYEEPL